MSSSRILKSNQPLEGLIPTEFTFQPISHIFDSSLRKKEAGVFEPSSIGPLSEENGGFIAMRLGDEDHELESPDSALEEEPPPPPSVTITEEELESRLRESYESGLCDGKNLAERGLLHVFNSLRTATQGLHEMRQKVLRESEDEMLKLIMMISRKVILREARADATILKDVVKAALSEISERDEIIIHLNPDDYNMVISRTDFFPAELMTERMRLKPDPTQHPGSCIVNTEMGTIDADFDSQLEEIYRHLMEERNNFPDDAPAPA